MTTPSIRRSGPEDEAWVQLRYAEIGFQAADFGVERIVIAEVDGQRCGLGRLAPLGGGEAELGGILVLEEHRGRGVAGRVVEHLLEHRAPFTRVFCLPFAHLRAFYERRGFRRVEAQAGGLPEKLIRKHAWCQRTYEHDVLLMILSESETSGDRR